MVNLLMKIKNIIIGNFNRAFHINNNKDRYNICKDCKYVRDIKGIGLMCGICYCIIKAKITIEEEHCPKGKW